MHVGCFMQPLLLDMNVFLLWRRMKERIVALNELVGTSGTIVLLSFCQFGRGKELVLWETSSKP